MQTLTDALIELVLSGDVDEETAANAAPNRHDFLIALGRALKEHAIEESREGAPDGEPDAAAIFGDDRPCAGTVSGSRDARAGTAGEPLRSRTASRL